MAAKSGDVLIKRGLRSNLPNRAELAQPLFATDTGELFIGLGSDRPPLKIGKSDYEIWLSQGNTGTVEDFYNATTRQTWQQAEW